jgi:hypothetical protein
MTITASGRSALILAAGLWICFGGPTQAASGATTTADAQSRSPGAPVALITKHASRHGKKYAHRKSGKLASKSTDDIPPAPTDVAADNGDKAPVAQSSDIQQSSSDIPSSVADANAQVTPGDTTVGNAGAMSARANTIMQAATADDPASTPPASNAQIVAPDQLNDVDRALRESNPSDSMPAPTQIAMASTDAAAAATAASDDSSTLDRTSLIGKIFIGVGALLTMASAVRMFIA